MIHPVHRSVIKQRGKQPHNMDKVIMSYEDMDFLTKQAISIFEDCVNSGITFQSALGSILLTGIKWGADE